jgi:multidrug efflux pump subunit AcrB
MNFRNISAWSIRNPIAPIVIFIALTLAGIVSFMQMEVQNEPDVEFPVVQISISQPGAAPTEIETQVTQRVEAAVRSITGIDEISSSVSEGYSSTVVQLTIGTPVDRAVNDIRNAVSQIRGDLPDGILEPQINRFESTGEDIASFSVASTDMTLEQLSWFVDNDVSKELLSVPGMASVSRTGGVSREIRVILDPAKMQSYGLTATQVNSQLRQVNANSAGGRVEIGGEEQSMRVLGNALDAYDLGQKEIAIGGNRTVKLADIADVRDLYAEQRSYATYNGQQVLAFSFQRAKNESDVTVYDGAKEKLAELQAAHPNVKFVELSNMVKYVEGQYHSAMAAMVEGAFLAVLVVFLFLRDWRATLISALAIPLSAIPAFWFMDMLGFTLNSFTLLALSLVAGVLVDDAIVEIENIVRHMRMGKTAYQASIDAADEIGLAVVATTMSIVAVFLPVGLMPGMTGQYFKNFGLTVVAAVLLSLAVARLITPMIAAYFLKAHGHAEHGEGWLMDRYLVFLRWTLRHRWVAVLAGTVALGMTVALAYTLPQSFQPPSDVDEANVAIELVPGATLEQTGRAARRVEAILRQAPEVGAIFSRVNVGNATVTAILKEDRARKSDEIQRELAPLLNQVPDVRASFRSQFNRGARDVMLVLGGDNPESLNAAANAVLEQAGGMKEIVAPRIASDMPRPEITIKPRLDLAAQLGVTTSALSQAIRVATLGDIDQNSARFSLSDRQIPIRVALNENARELLTTIENLPVPTASGGTVPLKLVAEISLGAGPSRIERINQARRITISADLASGVTTGQAWEKLNALPALQNLPTGVERVEYGNSKWQTELLTNFKTAVISGVLLVLAVLVLLYRRVMAPLVNMGSLLLAPLGGLLALLVTGHSLSMAVYIGLLMLLGIVAKNSILLVDFALEEIERGEDSETAIINAGHKRAQPIVMTTVAMVAGMIPTAISLSGDSAWRAPMGITVIGGLILSTLLTLIIVPASFSLVLGLEQKLGPYLRRTLTTGGKDAPVPDPVPDAAE